MSQSTDDLIFDGASGLSAGAFVRTVRQQSLARDKQDDDRWIAQRAASYFDGSALRWYEALDEETQESWKLLRRALLTRWPPDELLVPPPSTGWPIPSPTVSSPSSIAPTPAAAPPPSPATSLKLGTGPQIGRIKILLVPEDIPFGYVSRQTDPDGDLEACVNVSDAAIVRITPTSTPHGIQMMSGQADGPWLILVWDNSATETLLATHSMCCGFIRLAHGPEARVADLLGPTRHLGPARASIWNVLVDGSLIATWSGTPPSTYSLNVEVAMNPLQRYGHAIAVVNTSEMLAASSEWLKQRGYVKVRLVFEPM